MSSGPGAPLGFWSGSASRVDRREDAVTEAVQDTQRPVILVSDRGAYARVTGGTAILGAGVPDREALPIVGYSPANPPEHLGDPGFLSDHGVRYPYIAGAMANGIGSTEVVEAMGRAGMLGFFGAAGLPLEAVEAAIDRLSHSLEGRPYGFNLIHSPNEPDLESAVADLYIRRGVHLASASAYLDLTLPVVRYRVHGIHEDSEGRIVTPNRLIAKVSRLEVATKFFSPPPERFLKSLVDTGDINEEQARLAKRIPVAQDITAEADSGGHTDNQSALALIPTLMALRDQIQARHGYRQTLRVGAAGGISTPISAAAALSMGAAYILTGSVNQACVEAGTSDIVRKMLADAEQADVTMAPAADMFEMGVKVQVLKRGTMFAMRAQKLYELYRACDSLESIPKTDMAALEKSTFRAPVDVVWTQCRNFFADRDPSQLERAAKDPKHKMSLVFRWYLGQSSHWANAGDPTRIIDYQIWCGPAMGAFNGWVKGSFLEEPEERSVVTVALNILHGAALLTRINALRSQGVQTPRSWSEYWPRPIQPIQDKELRVQ
ncbi:MAG: PfaD family polyunsaturated fatty acid/polyketide biosynthesis protein [Acidobacteria bacterium]|nr:MAG: PfaD family polyunsaturated fatty acid/polyketide biosynthesis protein [Acidobacteriota bacterium]